eukprot:scaffold119489_cov28-Tisochrysis_lutea.AAC.5
MNQDSRQITTAAHRHQYRLILRRLLGAGHGFPARAGRSPFRSDDPFRARAGREGADDVGDAELPRGVPTASAVRPLPHELPKEVRERRASPPGARHRLAAPDLTVASGPEAREPFSGWLLQACVPSSSLSEDPREP